MLTKLENDYEKNFEEASSMFVGGRQSRKSLFSSIIETNEARLKVHTKRAVIEKTASPLRPRMATTVRKQLFGNRGAKKSSLDILDLRAKLSK